MASAEGLFSRHYSAGSVPKKNNNTFGEANSDTVNYPATMSSSVSESKKECVEDKQKDKSQVYIYSTRTCIYNFYYNYYKTFIHDM